MEKDEANYEKQIADDNLKLLNYLGYKENPSIIYHLLTGLFLLQRYEGYSWVTPGAALFWTVPIIATDCSGVRELLGSRFRKYWNYY